MVESVNCLPDKSEDLSLVSSTHVIPVIFPLWRNRQDLGSLSASLTKSASSRFNERFSQKVRWSTTEDRTQSVSGTGTHVSIRRNK